MYEEQISKLYPLTKSYEYAAEVGLLIRSMRSGYWHEFERIGLDRFPMAQSAGYAFLQFLEEHPEVSGEELEALCTAAIYQAPLFMARELTASIECIGRNYDAAQLDLRPKDLAGSSVTLFRSPSLPHRDISDWTAELLTTAEVDLHTAEFCEPIVLRWAHSQEYCDGLHDFSKSGGGFLTPETFIPEDVMWLVMGSAGCVKEAVEYAVGGKSRHVFCETYPGSHHAANSRAGGTCLVNNLAIGARAALKHVDRVAILDVDAHHGNGTQDIFYEDDRVLTVSLHQANPFFPGTGSEADHGFGMGAGFNINFEVEAGDNTLWENKFNKAIFELNRFRPDLLLIELSSDAHQLDPVSDLSLTNETYRKIALAIDDFMVPVIWELGNSLSKHAWQGALGEVISAVSKT